MRTIFFFPVLYVILTLAPQQSVKALNPLVVVANNSDGSYRLNTEGLEWLLKDPRVAEKKVLSFIVLI